MWTWSVRFCHFECLRHITLQGSGISRAAAVASKDDGSEEEHTPPRSGDKWKKKNEAVRVKLGLEPDARPWSGRGEVAMRCLRRQAVQPNFAHDQIDLSYVHFCKGNGLDWRTATREDLTFLISDIREGQGHARTDGNATMKTGSTLFYHYQDRVLCGHDHMLLQGWSLDVNVTTMNEPLPQPIMDAWADYQAGIGDEKMISPAAKKKARRTTKKNLEGFQKRAAGNGMCLPDMGLLQFCSLLATENDKLWTNPPYTGDLAVIQDTQQKQPVVTIDPNDHVVTNRMQLANQFQGSKNEFESDVDLEEHDFPDAPEGSD